MNFSDLLDEDNTLNTDKALKEFNYCKLLPGGSSYKFNKLDINKKKKYLRLVKRFKCFSMDELKVGEFIELRNLLGFGDTTIPSRSEQYKKAKEILNKIEGSDSSQLPPAEAGGLSVS